MPWCQKARWRLWVSANFSWNPPKWKWSTEMHTFWHTCRSPSPIKLCRRVSSQSGRRDLVSRTPEVLWILKSRGGRPVRPGMSCADDLWSNQNKACQVCQESSSAQIIQCFSHCYSVAHQLFPSFFLLPHPPLQLHLHSIRPHSPFCLWPISFHSPDPLPLLSPSPPSWRIGCAGGGSSTFIGGRPLGSRSPPNEKASTGSATTTTILSICSMQTAVQRERERERETQALGGKRETERCCPAWRDTNYGLSGRGRDRERKERRAMYRGGGGGSHSGSNDVLKIMLGGTRFIWGKMKSWTEIDS